MAFVKPIGFKQPLKTKSLSVENFLDFLKIMFKIRSAKNSELLKMKCVIPPNL